MGKQINDFLETQKKNRVAANIFRKLINLGYDDDFLKNKNRIEIEEIILKLQPSDIKAITTLCGFFNSYAKFIDDIDAYQNIKDIDRILLWEKVKPNAKDKYISHDTYLKAIHEIDMKEEMNILYYRTLFRVIYEGVYNDDLSVIANLRAANINGNIVELYTNDEKYRMELPSSLINDLLELSEIDKWERKNAYTIYTIAVSGKYYDSCFKFESRKDNSENVYNIYYNKLKKIIKEYVGYNISPFQLFVSGIMYRICKELNNSNISIDEAFALSNRNKTVATIMQKELNRCNYNTSIGNLKEIVLGHLDTFR